MKVSIYSDLHLEFYRGQGRSIVDNLPGDADVCILAGDITVGEDIPQVLEWFCDKYEHVIYVHGNHEFYGANRPAIIELTEEAVEDNPNLYWLNRSSVEIEGRRFLGSTLWFKEDPLAPHHHMTDFSVIMDFKSWVYEENRLDIEYFLNNVQEGDIVVTHHLPSKRSVAPQYADSPLNSFFLCNLEGLIQHQQPAYWFHGHTHSSFDYKIGKSRVVCNPLGYPHEYNQNFEAGKSFEL